MCVVPFAHNSIRRLAPATPPCPALLTQNTSRLQPLAMMPIIALAKVVTPMPVNSLTMAVGPSCLSQRSGQRHPAPPGHSKASLGPQAPQAACLPTHSPHNPLQPCGATTGPRLQPRPLHDASASAACAFTGRRAGPGDLKACQPKRSCQRPGAMQPMSAAACGQQQQQQQQQQKQHCLQEYSHKHGTGGKVARCVVAEEQVGGWGQRG